MVQKRICKRVAERFNQLHGGGVERVFEVGVGTGFLTAQLLQLFPNAHWFLNDITERSQHYIDKLITDIPHTYIWGDAESVEFPSDLDLVASASTVQWFDRLPLFIEHSYSATKDGGWLVLSTFGEDNYHEVKEVSGRGLRYYSLVEVADILTEQGYEVLHSEEYRDVQRFETPLEVLRHIRATGVNSIRQTHWSRGQFREFCERYSQNSGQSDGSVTLTYHPMIFIAQKK